MWFEAGDKTQLITMDVIAMLFIKSNKKMFSLGLLALAVCSILIQRNSEIISEPARFDEDINKTVNVKFLNNEINSHTIEPSTDPSIEDLKKYQPVKSEGHITHSDEQPETKNLFNIVSKDSAEEIDDTPEHSQIISMDIDALRNVTLGDSFHLPINNNNLSVAVSDIQHHKSGGMRIKLQVEGETSVYRAIFSIGEYVTKGKIITPTASYSLKMVNGNGWIIDRNLIQRVDKHHDMNISKNGTL
ncbi:MAG: hypothetical protein COA42_17250 [Alteromonadaceae bacterium]|nr:MAG: hypothetical protein COA42_17250 [Alteromonadaceae bacterium]